MIKSSLTIPNIAKAIIKNDNFWCNHIINEDNELIYLSFESDAFVKALNLNSSRLEAKLLDLKIPFDSTFVSENNETFIEEYRIVDGEDVYNSFSPKEAKVYAEDVLRLLEKDYSEGIEFLQHKIEKAKNNKLIPLTDSEIPSIESIAFNSSNNNYEDVLITLMNKGVNYNYVDPESNTSLFKKISMMSNKSIAILAKQHILESKKQNQISHNDFSL